MCGICGIYAPGRALDPAEADIASMLSAISHRGPDASGVHHAPNLSLGSARLAIIDLVRGNQPLYSEDRQVVAVYNGEIYNYRELQRELRGRGHKLASESDSEVLTHLFEEQGISFVERLNGIFGFTLWSEHERALYIARDRFGVKPVYYHWDGETLLFASEAKSILASGRVRPVLDREAFLELLTFQNVLSHRSLFDGIKLLPPASTLRLDESGLRIDTWWDPLPNPQPARDRDQLPHLVGEQFEAAVERQLVSDVELASYLSGGLDTGAVTAAAAPRLDRLTTFCTGFDTTGAEGMEAEFDERRDARELAQHLGTHHHELLLDPSDMEMVLPRLVHRLEVPRMSFSYPNYLTAGMTSRWVKVVLSGAGGDELFGGYPWRYEFAERDDFEGAYFGYWERLLRRDDMAGALAPGFARDVDLDRPRKVYDEFMAGGAQLSPLDRILYFESKTFLHGLLVLEDKLSMAHSLEARVPFLDNELVDFILTIPAQEKLQSGRSKDLFREAMRGRLPDNVRERKKTGFTPPQATWFQTSQREYVREVLLSERALERGIFRPGFIESVLDDHEKGRSDRRLLIWTLVCMEWWHRVFIDGEHAL
ncbi:MAG TPA: asparagine synthase (glutamine-hydrolyzing) [Thermoleophilaceae bacterium]